LAASIVHIPIKKKPKLDLFEFPELAETHDTSRAPRPTSSVSKENLAASTVHIPIKRRPQLDLFEFPELAVTHDTSRAPRPTIKITTDMLKNAVILKPSSGLRTVTSRVQNISVPAHLSAQSRVSADLSSRNAAESAVLNPQKNVVRVPLNQKPDSGLQVVERVIRVPVGGAPGSRSPIRDNAATTQRPHKSKTATQEPVSRKTDFRQLLETTSRATASPLTPRVQNVTNGSGRDNAATTQRPHKSKTATREPVSRKTDFRQLLETTARATASPLTPRVQNVTNGSGRANSAALFTNEVNTNSMQVYTEHKGRTTIREMLQTQMEKALRLRNKHFSESLIAKNQQLDLQQQHIDIHREAVKVYGEKMDQVIGLLHKLIDKR
jgi:hypothetical protein